ncbi:MAG: pentapeptide repeat-containing protein [Paludibacter sp.]|nr:pentapeptide repeat-containing protein [Paludibacter sp.]
MTKEEQEEEFKRRFGDSLSFNGETCIELLKFCSDVEDSTRWNEWRKDNPDIEVYLPEANLSKTYLVGANLQGAHLEGADFRNAHLEGINFTGAWLNGAKFEGATLSKKGKITIFNEAKLKKTTWSEGVNLERIDFKYAEFQGTDLHLAHFEGTDLSEAHFEEAILTEAHFERKSKDDLPTILDSVYFHGAQLERAIFNDNWLNNVHFEQIEDGKQTIISYSYFKNCLIVDSNFKKADLVHIDFTDAKVLETNFESANLSYSVLESTFINGHKIKTNLKGVNFTGATVNGRTKIKNCDIDENTNFTMVGLDSAQIEPSLLSALKTNIRRIAWNNYYKEQGKSLWGRIKTLPIRLFWWLSDYGSSSERIFLSILISILLFTNAYLIISIVAPNVISLPEQGTVTSRIIPVSGSYIRILCFAISTMVTLGFGGINVTIDKAFPGLSNFAFLVVTLNLVLGYLFLSVLVTRFGILFQSQAPEQKAKKTNNTLLYFVALMLLASSSYMLFCWEDIIGFINYAALITVLFGMGYFHFK